MLTTFTLSAKLMNSLAQPNLSVVPFLLEVAGRGGPRPQEDEGVGEAFRGITLTMRKFKDLDNFLFLEGDYTPYAVLEGFFRAGILEGVERLGMGGPERHE